MVSINFFLRVIELVLGNSQGLASVVIYKLHSPGEGYKGDNFLSSKPHQDNISR